MYSNKLYINRSLNRSLSFTLILYISYLIILEYRSIFIFFIIIIIMYSFHSFCVLIYVQYLTCTLYSPLLSPLLIPAAWSALNHQQIKEMKKKEAKCYEICGCWWLKRNFFSLCDLCRSLKLLFWFIVGIFFYRAGLTVFLEIWILDSCGMWLMWVDE